MNKEERLRVWLKEKMPLAKDLFVSPLEKVAGGFASETYFLDVSWVEGGQEKSLKLVMREEPTEFRVFPEYNMAAEFHTMRGLEGSDVPVPKTYWLEEDGEVLGAPFYLTGKVEGEVIDPQQPGEEPRGPLYEASPEERDKIWGQAIETLARINTVDWERLGFSFLGVPGGGTDVLDRQIGYYERMSRWAKLEPRSLLDAAFDWFRTNAYEPQRISLCWGDARLGNMMYRDDRVVAVLDWDMVHLGAPETDLAWLLAIDWLNSETGLRGPRWEGVPEREEIIRYFVSATGRSLENFFYHEAFAMFRLGIIFWRVIKSMPGIPPDFCPDNPPLNRLAKMLSIEQRF